MVVDERNAYLRSVQSVRRLLEVAGSADRVTPQDLAACRADLLAVKSWIDDVRALSPVLAASFAASPDVDALLARLAADESAPRSARRDHTPEARIREA